MLLVRYRGFLVVPILFRVDAILVVCFLHTVGRFNGFFHSGLPRYFYGEVVGSVESGAVLCRLCGAAFVCFFARRVVPRR